MPGIIVSTIHWTSAAIEKNDVADMTSSYPFPKPLFKSAVFGASKVSLVVQKLLAKRLNWQESLVVQNAALFVACHFAIAGNLSWTGP